MTYSQTYIDKLLLQGDRGDVTGVVLSVAMAPEYDVTVLPLQQLLSPEHNQKIVWIVFDAFINASKGR